MNRTIREAKLHDMEKIMRTIDAAKKIMRQSGNMKQWGEGIDTHRDNKIMQHNITKHSFTYCGIIYLLSGDERLAYQYVSKASE